MTTESPAPPAMNGAPPAASARETLRGSLPTVYRYPPDGFAMQFVGALEEVLDPIVAMLDLLPAHLDRTIAPPELIKLMADWFGLELHGALPPEAHRRIVTNADAITRARGTRKGLELLLGLAFEDLELKVEESGGATWSSEPYRLDPASEPVLIVTCTTRVEPHRRAAIRRVVEQVKPAHVRLDLRLEREES